MGGKKEASELPDSSERKSESGFHSSVGMMNRIEVKSVG